MAESTGDRTEAPTPRRRQEAREDGQIARSSDLTAACTLLAAVVLLQIFGSRIFTAMKLAVTMMLAGSHAHNPTRPEDLMNLSAFTWQVLLRTLVPVTVGLTAIALVVSVAQVGFLITTKPLMPQFNRLSPWKGLQNLFNMRGGARLIMSLGKVVLIGALAVYITLRDGAAMMHIGQMAVGPGFALTCALMYDLALKLASLLLVLAIFDYAFQRWQHERELKMTKQEIKEEMKRMEGDPLVKQRRVRVARQLAMQRMAQAVPKADVIVTNPTHFAVALQYDSATMRSPKVVAKGADFMAMRIRQLAAVHGVPIIERKPLARALYQGVEVGGEVPPEHYAAVAEILAYVYRLSGRRSA